MADMNKWNWNEFWEGFYFGLNPLNSIKYLLGMRRKFSLDKTIVRHCIYQKPSLWRRFVLRLNKDRYIDISPLKRVEIVQSIRNTKSLDEAVILMDGLARNGWLHLWDDVK